MESVKFISQCGDEHEIIFVKGEYADSDRLYVGCWCKDEEQCGYEQFCDITVNIAQDIPNNNYAFLDINNGEPGLFKLMHEKEWIKNTGAIGYSDSCNYPLVKFTEVFLQMLGTLKGIE